MKRIVVASIRKSAGKTSIIAGLFASSGKKCGYMKPFGDRLLYRKKRLWDYDAALISNLFMLDENPEEISIGFEHSKLRFMFDENAIKEKLSELAARTERGKDVLFIEGGADLSYGVSVNLDSISVAKHTGAKLVVVVSGNEDTVLDDLAFIKKYININGDAMMGVVINKVKDISDFKTTYMDSINRLKVNVLGIMPYLDELSKFTVGYLSDILFAKVVAGADGLKNAVGSIFVGAMSASEALKKPFFSEMDKLIITSGDRSDMIIAALESGASGIVITNNILPPSNIISMATDKKVPLLLVSSDTYATAKQIDELEPLMLKEESSKLDILAKAVAKNISMPL